MRPSVETFPRAAPACALRLGGQADPRAGFDRPRDIDALRPHGLDDAAIHDAIQVIAYFNYINRVADAVGIEDEPESG